MHKFMNIMIVNYVLITVNVFIIQFINLMIGSIEIHKLILDIVLVQKEERLKITCITMIENWVK